MVPKEDVNLAGAESVPMQTRCDCPIHRDRGAPNRLPTSCSPLSPSRAAGLTPLRKPSWRMPDGFDYPTTGEECEAQAMLAMATTTLDHGVMPSTDIETRSLEKTHDTPFRVSQKVVSLDGPVPLQLLLRAQSSAVPTSMCAARSRWSGHPVPSRTADNAPRQLPGTANELERVAGQSSDRSAPLEDIRQLC